MGPNPKSTAMDAFESGQFNHTFPWYHVSFQVQGNECIYLPSERGNLLLAIQLSVALGEEKIHSSSILKASVEHKKGGEGSLKHTR